MENATEPKQALCKFFCESVDHRCGGAKGIYLRCSYDPNLPEDKRFHEATPSGEMKFTVKNPALDGFFEPGKTYFVTLTPVPTE